MRITSFLSLLYFCGCCAWITIILGFGVPQSHIIKGPNILYIPIIVGVLQLAAALFCIHLGKRANPPPLKNPVFLRWVLLVLGLLALFCGYVTFNMSIFVASLFGSTYPVPQIGVVIWIVISAVLAALLYFASGMNSKRRPNLFRYIALVVALGAASLTAVQSLILIYAVPVELPTAFSFLSAILTVAFLPFAFLLLGLTKDYIHAMGSGLDQ